MNLPSASSQLYPVLAATPPVIIGKSSLPPLVDASAILKPILAVTPPKNPPL